MQPQKTEYKVLKDEFHGLLVLTKKNNESCKLYISTNLLEQNGLTFWRDADYYKNFLDKNIDNFIEGVEKDRYRVIYDGFLFV